MGGWGKKEQAGAGSRSKVTGALGGSEEEVRDPRSLPLPGGLADRDPGGAPTVCQEAAASRPHLHFHVGGAWMRPPSPAQVHGFLGPTQRSQPREEEVGEWWKAPLAE